MRRYLPALLLALAPLLLLWRPLFLGETFFYQDLAAQYFPREHLLVRDGAVGWNPHLFLGLPLLGDPQTAPFEPVRAVGRALGFAPERLFVFYVACYLLLATAGCFAFARRRGCSSLGAALAALAFTWGSLLILRIRHPWYLPTLALLPLVAIAADRLVERRRLFDALVVALAIAWAALGGHPQGPYMLWLFVGGWALLGLRGEPWRAWLALFGRLSVAAIAFLGLLAVYLLPVVELLHRSSRHGAGLVFSGSYSWNPWDWLRLLAPDVYGNDLYGTHYGTRNYHEQTIYLGIAPLLLFGLGLAWRVERKLAVVAVAAFALAAGRFLPLFYGFYFAVPGFSLFRAPVRYGSFFVLAAAVLAGLTLGRIERDQRPDVPERSARRLRAAWAVGAAVMVAATLVVGPWLDRYTEPGASLTMRWATARAALLLVLAGLVLDRWLRARLAGRRAALLLVGLTVADLALQWLPYRQTLPPEVAFPPPALVQALIDSAPGRVLVHDYRESGEPVIGPLLNWGEAAGYEDLRGYNQGVGGDLLEALRRADLSTLPREEYYALAPSDAADWLLDLAAVRRIVAPTDCWPARWRSLPLVARGGGYEVRERPAPPRAWLVGAAEVAVGAAALERLPAIDLHRVAVVDADVGLPRAPSDGSPGSASLVERRPDDVTVDVEATRAALLVLSDHYDAAWRASVDGAPRPIVRVDHLLRGVRVPPGRHRVTFHYAVPGRAIGLSVSLGTAIAIILFLLFGLVRQRSAT